MSEGEATGSDIRLGMFEAACDILGAAVMVYDRNDKLVFASRLIHRFFPVPAEYMKPGTRLRDVLGAIFDCGLCSTVPVETRQKAASREEWIALRISAHWREHYEAVERISRDCWIRLRMSRLANGCNVTTITDVSEEKKQEERRRVERERVLLTETILESIPSPLLVKDRNLTHIAANCAFRLIYDLAPEAILGRSAWDLTDADKAAAIERSDRAVLETGVPTRVAEHIVRADGTDLYAVTRKYRVGPPEDGVLVTLMEDVSEVVGSAGGAREGFAEAQNCVDPVRAVERRLLLEQLRPEDLAAVAGRRILVATPDRRVAAILVEELKKRGGESCAVRDRAECAAFLAQAAVRGLALDLLVLDDGLAGYQEIAGGDHGIPVSVITPDGIGPDFLRALTAGHGALAQIGDPPALAAADPVAFADDWYIATDEASMPAGAVGDIEVLVAEDNQINQFVFSQILEGLGISHRIAENGEEAVMLWRRHQPRLVLMDIAMPVKNGFDATAEIRAAEKGLGTRTPVVAVAARALDIDIETCLEAGMDDYLVKPVSPDMIEAIYRRHAAPQPEPAAARGPLSLS